MGWFLFGSIFLCIVLLPVFLAERWCRRHKAKKYFPVPKGMGWLQMVAVWMLYHLPGICKRIPVAERICR